MPAFHVSANAHIERSVEDVRDTILDFNTWPSWSPWLLLEPEAAVSYYGEPSAVGHGYQWEGTKVGSGGMAWTHIDATNLTAQLNFLKPFKSEATVGFKLSEESGGTKVEWLMDSSLPFFLFFMVRTMKNMITLDYTRGLALLKEYLEGGSVPLEMKAMGVVEVTPLHYLGINKQTTIDAIGSSMNTALNEVSEKIQALDITPAGPVLSVYHTMNLRTGRCDYTAAIAVNIEDGEPERKLAESLKPGTINEGRAYKVVYTGPYRHLGNAWALAMSDIRHLKMKPSKSQKPFELYINDPATTAENELITEVYVPVR